MLYRLSYIPMQTPGGFSAPGVRLATSKGMDGFGRRVKDPLEARRPIWISDKCWPTRIDGNVS